MIREGIVESIGNGPQHKAPIAGLTVVTTPDFINA
jgi:hypothetical protein